MVNITLGIFTSSLIINVGYKREIRTYNCFVKITPHFVDLNKMSNALLTSLRQRGLYLTFVPGFDIILVKYILGVFGVQLLNRINNYLFYILIILYICKVWQKEVQGQRVPQED